MDTNAVTPVRAKWCAGCGDSHPFTTKACPGCNNENLTERVVMQRVPGDQSQKADMGKADWLLFPWRAARWVLKVLEYGARRYSRGGWRKVDNAQERYTNALVRHAVAYAQGEYWDLCPEHPTHAERPESCTKCSGLPHLAHMNCDGLFLLELDPPESHPT